MSPLQPSWRASEPAVSVRRVRAEPARELASDGAIDRESAWRALWPDRSSAPPPIPTAPERAAPVWVAPPTEASPGSSVAAPATHIDRHAEPTPSTREHEDRQERARCRGTVKWFSDAKGYGFIRGDDGRDAFVHHSAIANTGFRSLTQGQAVEYEVQHSAKGFSAVSVTPLEASPTRSAWPAGAGPRSAPRP